MSLRSSPSLRARSLILLLGITGLACQTTRPHDTPERAAPEAAASSASPPPAVSAPESPAEERADASPIPAPKRPYVVAALGDSITDSRVGGGGYLTQLRHLCRSSVFLDFGKGGDMTNQMRRRFESDVVPQIGPKKIDTLLVYGGVNDLYSDLTAHRTNDRIEADLSAIYERARALGLRVVALTVSPWGGFTRYFNERRGDNTRLLNSWILSRPAEGKVDAVVDTYPLLSCGDPTRICPGYENRTRDGLHPGPAGHELLGRAVFELAFADCE